MQCSGIEKCQGKSKTEEDRERMKQMLKCCTRDIPPAFATEKRFCINTGTYVFLLREG